MFSSSFFQGKELKNFIVKHWILSMHWCLFNKTQYDSTLFIYIKQLSLIVILSPLVSAWIICAGSLGILLHHVNWNVMSFEYLQISYSYLDVVGRTVVVLEKKNVVPEHSIPFQVICKLIIQGKKNLVWKSTNCWLLDVLHASEWAKSTHKCF